MSASSATKHPPYIIQCIWYLMTPSSALWNIILLFKHCCNKLLWDDIGRVYMAFFSFFLNLGNMAIVLGLRLKAVLWKQCNFFIILCLLSFCLPCFLMNSFTFEWDWNVCSAKVWALYCILSSNGILLTAYLFPFWLNNKPTWLVLATELKICWMSLSALWDKKSFKCSHLVLVILVLRTFILLP